LDAKHKITVKRVDAGLVSNEICSWQHKTRIDNPILSAHDGPIYQLRRWYEQFYVDVKDVQPDMVDRFELEVDMTKPLALPSRPRRADNRRFPWPWPVGGRSGIFRAGYVTLTKAMFPARSTIRSSVALQILIHCRNAG